MAHTLTLTLDSKASFRPLTWSRQIRFYQEPS